MASKNGARAPSSAASKGAASSSSAAASQPQDHVRGQQRGAPRPHSAPRNPDREIYRKKIQTLYAERKLEDDRALGERLLRNELRAVLQRPSQEVGCVNCQKHVLAQYDGAMVKL